MTDQPKPLPDAFTYTADDGYYTYTATSIGNDLYAVTWREDDEKAYRMTYSAGRVSSYISSGEWIMQ